MEPTIQDYLIGGGTETERHRGNLLVHDLVSLHAKLSLLAGSKCDATQAAKHIVDVVHSGTPYTLPSSITASESFFTGGGRFLKKEGDDSWSEISDAAAVKLLSEQIKEEVEFLDTRGYGKEPTAEGAKTGDDTESESSGKSPSKRKGKAKSDDDTERVVTTKPNIDDVVLLDRTDPTEKTYVDHAGNAYLVLEISQFFTEQYMLSRAAIKGTRADAALATVYSLLGSAKDVGLDGTTSTKTRFLVRPKGTTNFKDKAKDGTEVWEVLSYAEAAEYILTLLFDKLVDKENIAAVLESVPAAAGKVPATTGPSTTPVKNFTEHDVLFGRGGLTNSHPGNRRFRDIILLHRPDYIRAIKIEKPNVARRIVRAIRCGSPPGRFLKKDRENGLWYDVGDRHAAEKTSQALREKTQAEKAARFDEDKRKRLRDGGLSQLASQRGVRTLPLLPLPALSPADLQRMVQAPYVPQMNMTGVPVMGSPFAVPVAVPPAKNGDKANDKDTPNGAKPAAAASLPPDATATLTAIDNGQKIATNQKREDEHGNILVTDSDVIAGRGGRRYTWCLLCVVHLKLSLFFILTHCLCSSPLSCSNHHVGNKRFRDIVALHRPDYIRAAKIHKPAVARMIVRALRNSDPPGRFLKKDEKTGKWYDIGDKKAAEKVHIRFLCRHTMVFIVCTSSHLTASRCFRLHKRFARRLKKSAIV